MNERALQPLTVLVGADDTYAMPLAVTLFSAFDKLAKSAVGRIYIIDGGMSRANKAHIENVLQNLSPNPTVSWLDADAQVIQALPPSSEKRISRATYLRLLAPYLIQSTRVLYLDSDVVVTGDITELWDIDMEGRALGAVRNLGTPTTNGEISDWQAQGLREDAPYFNAGVMLMDLDRWRTDKLSERVLENIRTHGRYYKFADQDALNAVLQDDWLELEQGWNAQVNDAAFGETPLAAHEIGVIHYTMNFKPWQWVAVGSSRPYHAKFFRSLEQSQWFTKGEYALFRACLLLNFVVSLPHRLFRRFNRTSPSFEEPKP